MRILHVVASIQAASGGPAVSVTRLASEQAKLGHEVVLANLNEPHLGPLVPAPGVRLLSQPAGFFATRGRGWSPKFRLAIAQEARSADLVHNHGLWMWPNAYARQAAHSAGIPLVVSPRGMLDTWSLQRSRRKKAVAWWLFEAKNLRSAGLFHATSAREIENIRACGLNQPAVMAPNGADLPALWPQPDRGSLERRFPILKGRRWFVFLSRLHPKKGLDILLGAWKRCAPDAMLVVAGPDLIGYRPAVERMICEFGLESSVLLTGELRGEEKDAALANAEVFVLPSYSENFGLVVAEAMAWARPVITTRATPWAEVETCGAGWWVAPTEAGIASALSEAWRTSADQLDAMGRAGRCLVESSYSWRSVAATITSAEERLLIGAI